MRDAPAIEIAHLLIGEGAVVHAYDPVATEKAKLDLGDSVEFFSSPMEAASGADAVVLATEWNEFRDLDWAAVLKTMRGDVLVDGRNLHEPDRMSDLGYRYFSMGRTDTNGQANTKPAMDHAQA